MLRSRQIRSSTGGSIAALERKFHDERSGPCLRRMEPEEIARDEAKRFASIEHLSEPEMLAMMQMSDTLRHQTIWHAERQRFSVPPFTLSTFLALKDQGLAERPTGRTFHILTAKGQQLADAVADYLVRHNQIHAPYMHGTHDATSTLFCTCRWSHTFRRWGNVQRKANLAFAQHVRSTKAINDMATALVPRHIGEADET